MEFLNTAEKQPDITTETSQTYAKLLAPLAPHLAEEIWQLSGGEGFVFDQSWPVHDPKLLLRKTLSIVIQVNGKLRGNIEVPADADEAAILRSARAHQNVERFLKGEKPKKEIYVKGKLVNFVI